MLKDTVSFLQRRCQENLFSWVEDQLDEPMLAKHKQVLWALEVIQIEKWLPKHQPFSVGRPPKDHYCIARALVAKHVMNLPTTDQLIHLLRVDKQLRYICGWQPYSSLPSKSTFSRVFARMAETSIPERVHEAVMKDLLGDEVVMHAVIDSMPIPVREKPIKKPKPKIYKDEDRVCYQQANFNMSPEDMLALVPTHCATGRKVKAGGNSYCWNGYKLHSSIAEGKFIISMGLSSANTNDNQMAIPLSQMSAERTNVLYELMDSAYDTADILSYISSHGRVPIVKEHKRTGKRKAAIEQERLACRNLGWLPPALKRLKLRSCAERVFARLTNEFSTLSVYVRGFLKVKAHIGLSVLAHTAAEMRTVPP